MPTLADTAQVRFVMPLLDAAQPSPAGLHDHRGLAAGSRYDVYRNNVTVGLIDALASIFPTVQRLIGEEAFREAARSYVRAHPPGSPLLFRYGGGFAAFLSAFEPLRSLPYLPDVARLERFWLDAYHAADAPMLANGTLGSVPAEDLGGLGFEPHPAARVLPSRYPIVTIFEANRSPGSSDERIDGSRPETALVTRPGLSVQLRVLPEPEAAFISALLSGACLSQAVGAGLKASPEFDPQRAIASMLSSGAFTGLRLSVDLGGDLS